ncbi:MAG: hypothetical protein JW717_06495 [Marinilabiliaceae bacterium]|nr:hypothetical protein [Marinilabiliaceae bacterium]
MTIIKNLLKEFRSFFDFDLNNSGFTNVFFVKTLQITMLLGYGGVIISSVLIMPSHIVFNFFIFSFLLTMLYLYVRSFENFLISKIAFLIIDISFLNTLFLLNGGINGPTLLVFVICFTLFVFFTEHLFQKFVIGVFLANLFLFMIIQYKFAYLIHDYLNYKMHFADNILIIFVSIVAEIPLVLFIQRYFVKSKLKMEEADRLKSAFLANMSHEIRTPMNAILGFSEMLRDKTISDTDKSHYLDVIRENGKILLQLINNIMQLSKIDAEIINLKESPIHLKTFLSKVLESFRNDLQRKSHIKTSIEVPINDHELVVLNDELMLFQIVSNLVANAIKYTDYGLIQLGYFLTEDRDSLIIFVSDTGIGIPESAKEFIFDRFRQADEDYSRDFSGSGLGLSICKELTLLLRGEIWVESKEKVGSTFYLSLPLHFASTDQIKIKKHQMN